MEKRKNAMVVLLPAAFLLVFLLWGLLKPDADISQSERRKLAQKPELTAASVWSGSFMSEFESYTLDQFPLRERFRQLRALTATGLLGQKDSHGIYLADGYAAKLDYPLDNDSVQHALASFQRIYEQYLAGTNVNILDISQTIVDGYFNMMMIVDVTNCSKEVAVVSKELEEIGTSIGVAIHCQREEIFEKMHRL